MNIFAISLCRFAALLAVGCALLFALPDAARAQSLPEVEFAVASTSLFEEGDSITGSFEKVINITRTGATTAALTVTYSFTHITTSTADIFSTGDFVFESGTITIPAEQAQAALTFKVANDSLVEDPDLDRALTRETFRVDIEMDAAYTIGGNGTLTVDIVESFGTFKPTVALGADTTTFFTPTLTAKHDGGMVLETDGSVDIPISIGTIRPQPGGITFYLVAAEGGTADGDDYATQTATFGGETITYLSKVAYTQATGSSASDGVMNFTVTVVDDQVTEGNETLEYTIATFSTDPAPDLAHHWHIHNTAGSGSLTIIDRPPSDDATLSALEPSIGMLVPDFDPTGVTFTYTLAVADSGIAFTPTVTDRASVEIQADGAGTAVASGVESGKIDLEVGAPKVILLVVTAQTKAAVNTYQITATREKSGDAMLSALESSAGADGIFSPAFPAAGIFAYALNVANEHTSITLTPTASQQNARIEIEVQDANRMTLAAKTEIASGAPSNSIAPSTDSVKLIVLTVTSEDGMATTTYTIRALRRKSSDATLREFRLSFDGMTETIPVTPGTLAYAVTVAFDVETVTVTSVVNHREATLSDWVLNGNAIASGDALSLNIGANELSVQVTSESQNNTNIHRLTIHRTDSPDATLRSLSVSPGILLPQFDSAVATYAVRVANTVTEITLTPAATESGASILVDGGAAATAQSLDVGENEIPVAVTAPDPVNMLTYTVIATRAESGASDDSSLSALAISEGALTFAPATTSYNLSYESSVTALKITPTASDSGAIIIVEGAQVESGSQSDEFTIVSGVQTISVVVIAPSAATTTYTLNITRASGPPGAPQNLTANPGHERIDLVWEAADPNGEAITGYQVRWKLQSAAAYQPEVDESGLRYSITTGLTNGSTYQAQVRAQNSRGDGDWAMAVAAPAAVSLPELPDLRLSISLTLNPGLQFPAAAGGTAPYTYALSALGSSLPSGLAFDIATRMLSGSTPAATSTSPVEINYRVRDAYGNTAARSFDLNFQAFTMDAGNSGSVSPQDGILFARYLLGVRGDGLTAGQTAETAGDVENNIQTGADSGFLDVDDSGKTDGTDGLLIVRYLLGLRGAALTAGLVEAGEEETKARTVEANMKVLVP